MKTPKMQNALKPIGAITPIRKNVGQASRLPSFHSRPQASGLEPTPQKAGRPRSIGEVSKRAVTGILFFAMFLLAGTPLLAEVPSQIHYQGLLADSNGNPLNGNRTIEVRLFDALTGGNELYHETIGPVAVVNGIYSFAFGGNGTGIAAALSGANDYLSVSVNGTEQIPRTKILAVPYALKAKESADAQLLATQVGGLQTQASGLSVNLTAVQAQTVALGANLTAATGQIESLAANVTALQTGTGGSQNAAELTDLLSRARGISLSGNLSFIDTPTSVRTHQFLTIKNTGFDRLMVRGIALPNGFSGNFTGAIEGFKSREVAVYFSPTEAKSYGGNLTVLSDATMGEAEIPVSGVGMTNSSGFVTTLAGGGAFDNRDGIGVEAGIRHPVALDVDASGNVFVAGGLNDIRKITSDATVTTLAGGAPIGSTYYGGYKDGQGGEARFNMPMGIALDEIGNIYVSDRDNDRIRKITQAGLVTTFAGSEITGVADREGRIAFQDLRGLDVDSDGNVYVIDPSYNSIFKITPEGTISIFAGKLASGGYVDGPSNEARFGSLYAIALDRDGNLYVTDSGRIRKITADGMVSTLAGSDSSGYADGQGTAASFSRPRGLAVDANGNVFVADTDNHRIRKITPDGNVTTLAGSGIEGFADGPGLQASFNSPYDVAVDSNGYVYVAHYRDGRIRKISP